MSNRSPIISAAFKKRPLTARRHVVATLSQEILSNPATKAFPLESEHQLCRRFGISRVTVRLALGDLEHRGLIFRKHGRGTFAHGRSTHVPRHIGVLLKVPQASGNEILTEMLRGVHSVTTTLRCAIILINQSPEQWQPELANALSGVIVISEAVTTKELECLQNRKMPFLIFGDSHLQGPRILPSPTEASTNRDTRPLGATIDFFAAGQFAAEALSRAALTGEPMSNLIVRCVNPCGETSGTVSMGISSETFYTQKVISY